VLPPYGVPVIQCAIDRAHHTTVSHRSLYLSPICLTACLSGCHRKGLRQRENTVDEPDGLYLHGIAPLHLLRHNLVFQHWKVGGAEIQHTLAYLYDAAISESITGPQYPAPASSKGAQVKLVSPLHVASIGTDLYAARFCDTVAGIEVATPYADQHRLTAFSSPEGLTEPGIKQGHRRIAGETGVPADGSGGKDTFRQNGWQVSHTGSVPEGA